MVGILLLIGGLLVSNCGTVSTHPTPSPPAPSPSSRPIPTPSPGIPIVYVHYYLWWTPQHWKQKLGPDYPAQDPALPAPGTMGSAGCGPQVSYPGAQIVDVPAEGLYSQNQAATFDHHIDLAAGAGITGFLVSWQGTGMAGQSPASPGYDGRLDLLVQRVDAYDSTHQPQFRLALAFAAYGNYNRPASEVIADLDYFISRYAADPAFENSYSGKPMVMLLDSRKYPKATLAAVSRAVGSRVYLLGDETASSWPADSRYLDGTSYYWSSENPWSNTRAGSSVEALGAAVHAQRKRWFPSFIPGYNKQLVGGSCVPRLGTQTLDKVWQVNVKSDPDGWFGISWNEFVENTYLEPSRLYGSAYLDALSQLIHG